MLLGHRFGTEPSEARDLFPDLGPGLVSRALSRTDYTSRQEHDAEMLASLLSLHLSPYGDDDVPDLLGLGLGGPARLSNAAFLHVTERPAQLLLDRVLIPSAFGSALPDVGAVTDSVRQQLALLRLRPLWRVLTGACPGVVLGTPPTLWDDMAAGRNLTLYLHRRVIEIRDAALALRPYVPGAAGARAARIVAEPGPHGERQRAAAEALCLHAALHNKTTAGVSPGTPVPALRPHPGPEEHSGSPDFSEEVRALCLVARAFHRNRPVQAGGPLQLLPWSG